MMNNYVYGYHAVTNLLNNPQRKIKIIYLNEARNDKRIQNILILAKKYDIQIRMLGINEMNKKFNLAEHQGVVALALPLAEYNEKDIKNLLDKKNLLILILDGITDPHNLGSCLRTSDGAGVDFVIVPKDKSAHITPVVSKVASGAAETVPLIKVTNLVRTIELIKEHGVWVYGAADAARKTLYDFDFKDSVAIVLGSEGEGLRRLTRESCDSLYTIPMNGNVSSLNVAVAGAISLYEVVRQRL